MDHHTSGQTDCVIQTAKMCKILAQQLTDQVIISRKRRPGETSKALVIKKPKLKKEKLFSNSLANCVKTFCWGCDQLIYLSRLRKHVRSHHNQGLPEYRKSYGSPEKQIIQLVYHTCKLCCRDVVLDYDVLNKHMRSEHRSTLAKYRAKHMVQSGPIFARGRETSITSPVLKIPPQLESTTRVTVVLRGCGGPSSSTPSSPTLRSDTPSTTRSNSPSSPTPAATSSPTPPSSSLILSTIPHLSKFTVTTARVPQS